MHMAHQRVSVLIVTCATPSDRICHRFVLPRIDDIGLLTGGSKAHTDGVARLERKRGFSMKEEFMTSNRTNAYKNHSILVGRFIYLMR